MKHRNWKNRLLALTLCAIMVMNYGMVALADTVSTGDAKGDTASKAEINPTVTPGDALNVDLTADVEEASVWEATLPALTGVYGDDVAAIAVSQLGYTESAVNVEQDSEGNITGHYSRYGAWNETPYAEWHALLAKFCISYAQIPQDRFPVADNAAAWVDALANENCGMFVPAVEEYEAMRGDLVFLDTDGMDGVDSVAVISEVAADGTMTVICEKDGAVVSESCSAADERIYGYGMMPFNMEGIEADTLEACNHKLDSTIEWPEYTYTKESGTTTGKKAFELDKTVNEGSAGTDTFELMLEAYATGEQTTVEIGIPMDIVLVLDRSGSMAQASHFMVANPKHKEEELHKGSTYYAYNLNGGGPRDVYIKSFDNKTGKNIEYYSYSYGYNKTPVDPIRYCSKCGKWIKEVVRDTLEKDPVTGLYKKVRVTTYEEVDPTDKKTTLYEPNVQATERSLKQFLAMINAHGETYQVTHRVAIVEYVSTDATEYPGVKYSGVDSYFNNVDAHFETIRGHIEEYSYFPYGKGNTPTHRGLQVAQEILKARTADNTPDYDERKQMVVLFADGAPGSGTTYYTNWANIAMRTAQEIKDTGVPIYVVGLYDSANADQYSDDLAGKYNDKNSYYEVSNRFFNLVSSNYAVKMSSNTKLYPTGTASANQKVSDAVLLGDDNPEDARNGKEYFYGARGADELMAAFMDVAKALESKTVSIDLDDTTILRDQLSKYFELDCDCKDGNHTCVTVKAYTQEYNGEDFEAPVEVGPDDGITVSIVDDTSQTPTRQVIDVTGFDYAANAVVEGVAGGKKLVVKIQIETREGFWGGNNVPTNDNSSAIYTVDETKPDQLTRYEWFPRPEVNVPLHVDIVAKDKTIYYGGDISPIDLADVITAGYKTTAGDASDPDNQVTDIPVTVDSTGKLVPAEPWMDDYADMTVTSTEEIDNKKCEKEYPITVTLKAKYDGTTNRQALASNLVGDRVATPLTDTDAGDVHILVPAVTFKDSTINFGFIPDKEYFDSTNFVPTVIWMEKTEHTEYPAVDKSTEPTLTYLYESLGTTNFTEDTPINVKVISSKVDGKQQDITAITAFRWNACTNNALHDNTEDTPEHFGGKNADGSEVQEFYIHVGDPYVLPATGGIGTYWYTISGLLLMLGAAMIMHKTKYEEVLRRKEKNT